MSPPSLDIMDNIIAIDDESLDAVGRGLDDAEGYFSVGSGEEDEVEVTMCVCVCVCSPMMMYKITLSVD